MIDYIIFTLQVKVCIVGCLILMRHSLRREKYKSILKYNDLKLLVLDLFNNFWKGHIEKVTCLLLLKIMNE